MSTLETELATYRKQLLNLLPNEGQFVLIVGDKVIGLYDTCEEAISAGYQRFGRIPLFVQKIARKEEVAAVNSPFSIKAICPQ